MGEGNTLRRIHNTLCILLLPLVHNINICFLAEEDEKTALLQHDDEDDDDDEASSMYTKNFRRPTVCFIVDNAWTLNNKLIAKRSRDNFKILKREENVACISITS